MTSVLHMLDTDTTSYIIKGHSPVLESRLAEIPPDRLCISAVTRAELMYGLKRLAPAHRLHLAVGQFLKIVRVPAWGADAADYYADIRYRLTRSGQPIGEMDMMIAAHALAVGAVLVSNNTGHFERIDAPLALTNWLHG
ncbi:type II toxin-antitoxin system VapC family toxin [Thioalkalivibrio paradoxus]|uniref:Ribonuclease VapC n=1 Tax=Thioalkalivibrio paradoxus ARh 1 TaxID=713585 RepID=W0DJE5_9GAMM|nr:type II toxin-antitoxin system VapC family toxin [Thioalkalivibrio paradoxus]AHE98704.1 twitching motility protein PilT [Thioalkalivibrio paradoxus ARh 1]